MKEEAIPTGSPLAMDLELQSRRAKANRGEGRQLRVQLPPSHRASKLRRSCPRPDFSWITGNLDAAHLKPVIRTATASWVCIILLVATKTQETMGQSSFLILISAFLSPPAEPFVAVFEREIANVLFVAVSFAWCCLAIVLSSLARKEFNKSATPHEIFSGRYIETGPTVICAVFLFIGTAFMLYSRARIGQGPYVIAPTLGCIVIDITLTVAHFYPYISYSTGISCVISFYFHSAAAIACSVLVFPETINAQFIKRFRGVFVPLSKAMRTQPGLFAAPTMSEDIDPDLFIKLVAQAEAALAPLAASSRLMKKDLSWGRFGSEDFSRLHELVRHMAVRANGMVFYFKIIGPQPGMPALSVLSTPWSTPSHSRPPSPTRSQGEATSASNSSVKSTGRHHSHRNNAHAHSSHHFFSTLRRHHTLHGHNQHHRSHHSPLTPSLSARHSLTFQVENAVGVFESQRYLNLEARFSHPSADDLFPRIMELLGESTGDLVACCADTLDHVVDWLGRMNKDRFWKLYGRKRGKSWEEAARGDQDAMMRLRRVLDDFLVRKRHLVLALYRSAVDPIHGGPPENQPPHLFLFQCYLYQYHLMSFSEHLWQFLNEMIRLEKTRHRSRFWLPVLPLRKIFIWSNWEPVDESLQHTQDEDPNIIQGIDPESQQLLDTPTRRNPDALPPANAFEAVGIVFYHAFSALGHGNAVFGFKAGVLSIILSLPVYIQSSSEFSYVNRSVWALIYGQLTISRFRGDTAFGWSSRVLATFLGGLAGTVMWYMSTGLGKGNAIGLAAVTAVCFPVFYFIRFNYAAQPMTLTIFIMTVGLVLGYSWQDTHDPTLSNAGRGVSVAWKRFVLVTIGVAVAFILSFLPPTTTIRRYLRMSCATTAEQLGQLYCDIVSSATSPDGPHREIITKDLIALRMKLRRSIALKQNVAYEFSLRGKWPEARYNTVNEIQMEIAYLLSHLKSVTEHLELSWARAFLKRTRFLEPEFQGDVLGVISMISFALRTGKPLPQVTPCPLLDRFATNFYGLNVFHQDDEADYGLPRTLTVETLENEQYLYFSVGVATAFGIITRLDRLMIATKELVGEQYHIHGLPVYIHKAKDVQ
ncbi:hypothetical protein DFH11DRAFT_1629750 [Phellopilus nigrolimitatus]|nr:hypothetical protein DFH11DRAFT_1629750 [Phellopilus nigrolimitatus]